MSEKMRKSGKQRVMVMNWVGSRSKVSLAPVLMMRRTLERSGRWAQEGSIGRAGSQSFCGNTFWSTAGVLITGGASSFSVLECGFPVDATCGADVECEAAICEAAVCADGFTSSWLGLNDRCDGRTLSVPSWKYDTKTKTAKMIGMQTTVMAVKCTCRSNMVGDVCNERQSFAPLARPRE